MAAALPPEPTPAELRDAWRAADEAEADARELRRAARRLMYAAYLHGWKAGEIGDAVGIGHGAAGTRRVHRALREPFEAQMAEHE